MNLQPSDIDMMEEAGILEGKPVKLVRTTGGFWIGIVNGKVVSGGSHPAIVKHTISKMFPSFQPVLCKSENFGADAIVDKHSHFLSDDLRKSGHDIYSIQNGSDIEFQITKHNVRIGSINSTIQDNSLFIPELNFPEEFTHALAAATTEKAIALKSKSIKIK